MTTLLNVLGLAKLKTVCATWFAAVLWLSSLSTTELRATTFGPPEHDRFNTGGLACEVHARPNKIAKKFVDDGALVAHRTLDCWTEIIITNTRNGRAERAVVADRGPYGSNAQGIDVWEGAPDEPGIAKRLLLNGDQTVLVKLTGRVHAVDRKRKEVERTDF